MLERSGVSVTEFSLWSLDGVSGNESQLHLYKGPYCLAHFVHWMWVCGRL